MSAEISNKLHRPELPPLKGQKVEDTETDRQHIEGPAKSTNPAKS